MSKWKLKLEAFNYPMCSSKDHKVYSCYNHDICLYRTHPEGKETFVSFGGYILDTEFPEEQWKAHVEAVESLPALIFDEDKLTLEDVQQWVKDNWDFLKDHPRFFGIFDEFAWVIHETLDRYTTAAKYGHEDDYFWGNDLS